MPRSPRARLARLAFIAAALSAGVLPAQSQPYPAKPVRFVVPLAPGGGADTFGRFVGRHFSESLGQQFVVENRAGGGGVIGGDYVAKAAPDGYTLLVGGAGLLVASLTYRKFDMQKDFTPVVMMMDQPSLVVVHASLPVRDIAELIKLARARPGQLDYASAGTGSAGHLFTEMFRIAAGIDIVHIPYKGAGAAMADLMSGQVSLLFGSPLGALPHVKAGRVRGLAVSSARRMSGMPEIPTISESGLPGFSATSFLGLLGPAALPRDIVARLNAEALKIAQRPAVRDWFVQQGAEPAAGSPEDFASRIRADTQKFDKVLREANVRLN